MFMKFKEQNKNKLKKDYTKNSIICHYKFNYIYFIKFIKFIHVAIVVIAIVTKPLPNNLIWIQVKEFVRLKNAEV